MSSFLFCAKNVSTGHVVRFYSDRTWYVGDNPNNAGLWSEAPGGVLLVDVVNYEMSPAIGYLQQAYDQWREKMERTVAEIIVT